MSRRQRPRPRPDGSDRDLRAGRPIPPNRPEAAGGTRRSRRTSKTIEPPPLQGVTLALVLLRLFLGITFIYAGLDKLIDPTFLQASGAGSIGAQLDSFVRASPIGILVEIFARPFPIFTGLVVSVLEIAIGLGALTGLLFRLAAVGGAVLSITFWLTASWAIKPYYYGPDLPYAAGWIVLAIAGHGGRFLLDPWLARQLDLEPDNEAPYSVERRRLIQGGTLALGTVVIASLGGTLGALVFGRSSPTRDAMTTVPRARVPPWINRRRSTE